MEKQTSSPLIESLSVQLQQIILSNIPDVLSLRSAALSCRALYNALLSAETIITTRALLNQVSFDVLPEAYITQEAIRLERHTEKNVRDFIARHLHERRPPPEIWTLCDAVRAAKLHACVNELALQFIANTAKKPPVCGTRPATRAEISRVEISRVERAMYRFEILCNLFREFWDSNLLEQLWDVFFSNFSPWENEQLACVQDYLVQAVSPAFNDIAEHDIAWGEFRVEYSDERDSIFIQYLLSLGLETLRRISMAETYEARYGLLIDDAVPHSDFTPTDERTHIRPPFFNDPDTGSPDIWKWAHQDESWANFVNQDNRKTLREWGYVMCDRARMDDYGIFQSRWEPPYHNDAESKAYIKRCAEMQASWEARSKIFRSGGRGCWSFGDHSKIIWPNRKAPWKGRFVPAHAIPNSLEETRDAFRLMKLPEPVAGLNEV
ncbi:hypothetical protein yc1106_00025 [Curvularia clavata]|uniref:F-box domain-containing protein n=1 Tax=Curvularia clavata TaxID=95742 RepID=A0A9Q8YZB3_CURCL|nr:hypothetical protein yc1106_00025 [Curvularia clavata]